MPVNPFNRQFLIQELSNNCTVDEISTIELWFQDALVDHTSHEILNDHLRRIKLGEPVQIVFGYTHFYKSKFNVSSHTLIPRPETEELVELILKAFPEKQPNNNLNILDIGTGSGCIALSLLKERTSWTATGLDVSSMALDVSIQNANLLGVSNRFQTICADFLTTEIHFSDFDIIVSNPPYIPIQEMELLDKKVIDYEPHSALFVEKDPLIFYKRTATQLKKCQNEPLKKTKGIFLETHQNYNDETFALFENFKSEFSQIKKIEDFSGNPRFVKILK